MRKLEKILVTGGAGFIGSNFIRYLFGLSDVGKTFCDSDFDGIIVNADCLTYAGNLENLSDVEKKFGSSRYFFEKIDICNRVAVEEVLKKYQIDTIIHFAAESHVDRSILGPEAFIKTNVLGTFNLLDAAKNFWLQKDGSFLDGALFHHISTDEVYGSLGDAGYFTEDTPYNPRSPYSASKASSDHIAMSFFHTYGFPLTLSNCSNNYGPFQFPEKFLPLMITNICAGKPLPVYGEGKNIRDWIYVEDHNRAVWQIIKNGRVGQKYNIGGENEWKNIDLLQKMIEIVAEKIKKPIEEIQKTIKYVSDRPGHDFRYAIDCSKIKAELDWSRKMTFAEGLRATADWYLSPKNASWLNHIQSGEYKNWLEKNYDLR